MYLSVVLLFAKPVESLRDINMYLSVVLLFAKPVESLGNIHVPITEGYIHVPISGIIVC